MQRKKKIKENKEMAILGHLNELRKCLLIIFISYIAGVMVCYLFAPDFIHYAISRADGYYFVQTGVADLMAEYIKISLLAALAVDLPVIIWQIYRFVSPGLKKTEEVKVFTVLIGGVLLFLLGMVFANYIVIPITLQFFLSLNTLEIAGMYSIKEYIGYLMSVLFSCGIVFEIPVVTAILASLGILNPKWMKESRKIVILVCLIVGAVITPPDVVSQILVAVPMYVMYEISIVVSGKVYKDRIRRLEQEEADLI